MTNQVNYGYTLLEAYNTKGADTKDFNMTYADAFDAYSKIKYVGDDELQKYVDIVYPSQFLKSIEVGNESVGEWKVGSKMEPAQYVIQNANSGLFLNAQENAIVQDVDGFCRKLKVDSTISKWNLHSAILPRFRFRNKAQGKEFICNLRMR